MQLFSYTLFALTYAAPVPNSSATVPGNDNTATNSVQPMVPPATSNGQGSGSASAPRIY